MAQWSVLFSISRYNLFVLSALCVGDVEGFNRQMLLWSTYDSIADCVDAHQPDSTTPAAMQVDLEVPASNPLGGTATPSDQTNSSGSGQVSVQEYLLKELCSVLCVSPKEEVRCAGVVVLVSLLQLCSGSGLIKEQLPRLQSTFTGLLGDSNDLTQVRFGGGGRTKAPGGGQGPRGPCRTRLMNAVCRATPLTQTVTCGIC